MLKDEVLKKIENGAELSDEELSAVSGGVSANSGDEIYILSRNMSTITTRQATMRLSK